MAQLTEKIKNNIGKMVGGSPPTSTATTVPQTTPDTSKDKAITIKRRSTEPITTSNMSVEELKARRIERVENASNLVETFHVKVMLRFLDMVCLVGPFWILVFCTSEVGQLFTGKPFSITDQTSVNMYATALFGEAILAGLTFVWQYAASYLNALEVGSKEYRRTQKMVRGMGLTWALFAGVSALGQAVYLHTIWHDGGWWSYVLIGGRVTLYTAGDWACAKYLGWRVNTLRKLAQEEKAKGEVYQEMAEQEGERRRIEKKADQDIKAIDVQIQTQERTAKVTSDVQETMSKAAVKFLNQFTKTLDVVMNSALASVNDRLQMPAVDGEVKELDEPDTGDL